MSPALAALTVLRERVQQPRVLSCAALTLASPLCVATGLAKAESHTVVAGLAGCVLGPVGLLVAVVRGPR